MATGDLCFTPPHTRVHTHTHTCHKSGPTSPCGVQPEGSSLEAISTSPGESIPLMASSHSAFLSGHHQCHARP